MKTIIQKITLLLSLFAITFATAQELSSIPSNGGADTSTNSRVVTDWLFHGDGTNSSNLGTSSGSFTLGAQIKLTTSMLAPHAGRQIEELKFYIGDISILTTSYNIEIYTSLTGAADYAEALDTSTLVLGWNTVVLATPYLITGTEELFVGYYIETTTAGYPNGIDPGPSVPGMNFYNFSGGGWSALEGVGDWNFNIQAGVGGATGANDVGMLSINMEGTIEAGTIAIEGTLMNLGTNVLSSVEVNWQVDGGTTYTETLTGLDLATGENYNFTHADAWTATNGAHNLSVWVSNMNGIGTDELPVNDNIDKAIMVINEIFPRTVVYEEGTGTWCGWCVRGLVGLKDMAHYHDDGSWIGIGVHNGDPMVDAAYNSALGISSFPSGKINRKSSSVDPGLSTLESAYSSERAITPLAKIDITDKSWNTSTREITVEVTTNFALDMASADYNAALIIVEDGVTGTASGYAQANYYASNGIDMIDWEGINWRYLGNPIPAADMVYNHVGRSLVGGWAGVAGSIPASVAYGTGYTYTFTHTLPANQNEDEIELVAIVLDNQTGQIENATSIRMDQSIGIDEHNHEISFNIFPNPSNGILNITTDRKIDISIHDILGKFVYSNSIENSKTMDLSHLNSGVYIITVTDGKNQSSQKLVISN